jgi:predicted nucleotidyltransferase
MKTEGVSNYAKDLLSQVSGVEVAFIYGSFASAEADKGSDLDLFIVGDVNEDELLKKISSLEEMVNREINYFLITTDELKARSKKEDAFLYNVLEGPKIMIIGDLDVGLIF